MNNKLFLVNNNSKAIRIPKISTGFIQTEDMATLSVLNIYEEKIMEYILMMMLLS
jgi:hypothetical protein